ncbi:hypothetical protein GCM10010442_47710 [Kitasatospora kifunensis]
MAEQPTFNQAPGSEGSAPLARCRVLGYPEVPSAPSHLEAPDPASGVADRDQRTGRRRVELD